MDVVRNRVNAKRFKSTYCDTVMQYRQFSWTHPYRFKLKASGGAKHWHDFMMKRHGKNVYRMKAYRRALTEAATFIKDQPTDITYGATHYYTTKFHREGGASWSKGVKPVAVIGNHVFFKNVR